MPPALLWFGQNSGDTGDGGWHACDRVCRLPFSDTVRRREPPPCEYMGEPELCGSRVEEIILPDTIRKVGAYGFYNCSGLKRLSCSSAVEDWGAGVFTGCTGLRCLDIRVAEGRKSCFKDILSELHQTLSVNYRSSSGTLLAKLIFPEFLRSPWRTHRPASS